MQTLLALLATASTLGSGGDDPRTAYDVEAYYLALAIDPVRGELSGKVTMQVRVLVESLDTLALDHVT